MENNIEKQLKDIIQKDKNIEYIKWKDIEKILGKKRYKEFQEFMFGQTCYPEGVFLHDFYNFLRPPERRFFD